MQINAINNSLSFQQRIKMDKNKIGNIASKVIAGTVVAVSGASAAASLGAQTDFDMAISQSSVKASHYKGYTIPLIEKLNEGGDSFGNSLGVALSLPLSLQGSGFMGSMMLDVASNGKLSEAADNIAVDKNKELAATNAATSAIAGLMLSQPVDTENAATIGTTALPLATYDTVVIADAYDRSSSNKKIPS